MKWVSLALAVGCAALAAGSPGRDLAYLYRSTCAACHGLDGTAKGPGGVRLPGRALANAGWLARQEDQALIRSILKGKGAMPSFKEKLTPEDCKRLLTEVVRPLAKPGRRKATTRAAAQ